MALHEFMAIAVRSVVAGDAGAWRERERTLRWSAASGGCALAMMLLVALEKV